MWTDLLENISLWYNTIRARTNGPRPNLCQRRENTAAMEISWLGHSCFQLRGKNVTLVTDPFSPQQGSSQGESSQLGKISASIVTVSHNHAGHNNVVAVSENPYVVK